jgi:beta-glucanase (GH16 family)
VKSVRALVFVLLCLAVTSTGLALAAVLGPVVTPTKEARSPRHATGPAFVPNWGRPVWRDEFDGPSLDTGRWNARDRDHTDYDAATMYADQAQVRGGRLVLRAERIDPARDPFHNAWATGFVDTLDGKFSQRYGRFEISARLPTTPRHSRGLWPSFWLRDDEGPGEIDVMEAWGTPSTKPHEEERGSYTWTVHPDTHDGSQQFSGTARPDRHPSLSQGFHRYAAEWTPGGIRFLLDDVLVGEVTTAEHPWLRTSFPSAVNIRLQLAVGSNYWGFPDRRTTSPAEYVIDYVRVWAYRAQ